MGRLEDLREQAVEYLARHLGFQIPDEVADGCRRAICSSSRRSRASGAPTRASC